MYDCLVVHAGPNEFEGDTASHGRELLGEPYLTHAAFAEFADESEALGNNLVGRERHGGDIFSRRSERWGVEETLRQVAVGG